MMRRIPRETAALGLLKRYLDLLGQEALATPELQHVAVSHIYDLAAVALGATRDAAEAAAGRGLAAARLTAIKADILRIQPIRPLTHRARQAPRRHAALHQGAARAGGN